LIRDASERVERGSGDDFRLLIRIHSTQWSNHLPQTIRGREDSSLVKWNLDWQSPKRMKFGLAFCWCLGFSGLQVLFWEQTF